MEDLLRLVEAEIDRIRRRLYATQQTSALLVDSPMHQRLDKLIALHAQISLERKRAPGPKNAHKR